MEEKITDLSMLTQKMEKQERFTRTITIVCCISVLSVMFFTLSEVMNTLPQLVVLHYMANVEPLLKEWKLVQSKLDASAAKHSKNENSSY